MSYQQSNFTELEDVSVQVYGRKGDRGDILRTQRCEYNPLLGDFLNFGPVQIELSAHASDIPGTGVQGKHRVFIETSKVTYHQGDETAETDEPVKFHVGPASGTAVGMTYATRDGRLVLSHDVAVNLIQGTERAPQPPIHLTASGLRYDKEGGLVELAGPVEVTQGERHTVADGANLALDDKNRVSRVVLEGHTKAFDTSPLYRDELNAKRVQGDFDAGLRPIATRYRGTGGGGTVHNKRNY